MVTLAALSSLARILGGLPGRKNLIWVAGDLRDFSFVPEDRAMSQEEIDEAQAGINTRRVGEHAAGNSEETFRTSHAQEVREVAGRLASAQVAVYPVDARGLSISSSIDSQEAMREMARETGGRAYVNQNEIKMGVERAFEDESAAYTIGYYPENKKYDNKYRSIKVKVKRDGVEIQSRRGYYAIDPTQIKGYDAKQEVAAAVNDVVPSTLVSFRAQVKPPSTNSDHSKIGVTFLVDGNTLSAEDGPGGSKHLKFEYYATTYAGGKIVAGASKKVDQTFDANTYQQILQQGIALHLDLDPQPGTAAPRCAGHPYGSGRNHRCACAKSIGSARVLAGGRTFCRMCVPISSSEVWLPSRHSDSRSLDQSAAMQPRDIAKILLRCSPTGFVTQRDPLMRV